MAVEVELLLRLETRSSIPLTPFSSKLATRSMRLNHTLKCLPCLVQLSGIALGLGIVVRVLECDLAIVGGGLFLIVGVLFSMKL